MKRREFLKLSAFTVASSVALSACAAAPRRIESRVSMPEVNPVDGEVWYASTCPGCPSACGIVVRTIEGRAKKIEGNPEHPVNRGKLCARGQAGLQALYNPDRIRGPLKRTGDRGQGQFEPIEWDQAMSEATARLQEAVASGGPGSVLCITGAVDGHAGLVVDAFARALGSPGRVVFQPTSDVNAAVWANGVTFGVEALADYDIDNADYVLSFGANFLEGGLAPVRYGRGYGHMRQGRPGRRGRLVQVEPRLSLTAANADLWLPANPGTEGALALGIAHVILAEELQSPDSGLTDQDLSSWQAALAVHSPTSVADITGVPAERIIAIAREFASAQPGLAIGGGCVAGHTNAGSTLVAINALNVLAGNVGKPGGVRFASQLPLEGSLLSTPTPFRDVQAQIDAARAGQVSAVLLYEANPAFTAPAAADMRGALAQVPFVLSFASFLDESAAYADLVLPNHTYLERWDTHVPAAGADRAVLSVAQPVVNPLYDGTRPATDVLLAIAREMGGEVAEALPWASFADVLQEAAAELQQTGRGSVRGGTPDEFWEGMLQHGGWWDETAAPAPLASDRPASGVAVPRYEPPRFEGDPSAYPLHLHVFESAAFGDGRGANLPWLQEMPDPMTTVVWGTWVELNPQTARDLGLQEGDLLTVESPYGRVEAPLFLHPGLMPNVVAIPLGQGHSVYGQYAANRGANPMDLLAPTAEPQVGALAFAATRAKVTKAPGVGKLVKTEARSRRLPGHAFFE